MLKEQTNKPRWQDHDLYRRVRQSKKNVESIDPQSQAKLNTLPQHKQLISDCAELLTWVSDGVQFVHCSGHGIFESAEDDLDVVISEPNLETHAKLCNHVLFLHACGSDPTPKTDWRIANPRGYWGYITAHSEISHACKYAIHGTSPDVEDAVNAEPTLISHSRGALYTQYAQVLNKLRKWQSAPTWGEVRTLIPASIANTEPVEAATLSQWISSPTEILQRLESPQTSEEDLITAVLFAETTALPESLKPRFLDALHQFADLNRFSKGEEVITAVGSAVRKLAMNMPNDQFESYASLFLPTSTNTLSCGVELELAKAVGWRLVKLQHAKAGDFPELEARLSELASDYLSPRLILQENYAAIVINAVLAVCLLNGERQDELIDRVIRLKMDWFRDLLSRRLLDVAQKRQAVESGDAENIIRLHKLLALVAQ